jgi:uncharacterized protein YfaS (alpha-2-macroglobulin family)
MRRTRGRLTSSPASSPFFPILVSLLFATLLHPALGPPPARAAEQTFTITKIEPRIDPAQREQRGIALQFNAPCDASIVEKALKVLPPVAQQRGAIRLRQEAPDRVALFGRFEPGKNYTVFLPDDFACGGRKYSRSTTSVTMPDLPSKITFQEKGSAIERDSRQILNLSLTNVEELDVRALRLPLLLVPAASSASGFDRVRELATARYDALRKSLGGDPAFRPFLVEPVESRQAFRPGKPRNEAATFSVPLSFRKDREKGAALAVTATGAGSGREAGNPVKVLCVTDIGLATKRSRNSLLVWATSLRTGQPLAGVAILAVTSDGFAIPLGTTGKDGLLGAQGFRQLRAVPLEEKKTREKPVAAGDVAFVLAATKEDAAFLAVGDGDLAADWIGGGEPMRIGDRLLRGLVFTERGIYRPGESVHFKGTVRAYRSGAVGPPEKLSVAFTVINSRQEEVFRKTVPLSEFGTAADVLKIPSHFPLGTYTVKMAPEGIDAVGAARPGKTAVNEDDPEEEWGDEAAPARVDATGAVTATFEVQEVRPPRHFTSVRFRKIVRKDESYVNLAKETAVLEAEIHGSYYAGGGVKNGKVRWKIAYAPSKFRPKGHGEFLFGSSPEGKTEMLESGEAVLDGRGKAVVTVPLSPEVLSGAYGLEASAVVVDFDGRAASGSVVYQEDPPYLVGIGPHDAETGVGEARNLRLIVLDRDGRRVKTGKLLAEVQRQDWVYLRKRNADGDVFWTSEQVYRKQLSSSLTMKNGEARFEFDFVLGGDYLLKFRYQGANEGVGISTARIHVRGPSYAWRGDTRKQSFERLSAAADRKVYAPGDTARIYVNPHRKVTSLLMTVERDRVIEVRVLPWSPDRKYVEVPLTGRHAPNVYVSLLGVTSRGEFPVYGGGFDDEAPSFLYGVVPLEVRKRPEELRVTVNEGMASLRALPGEEQKLTLSVRDGKGRPAEAEVALAVVDESFLALTGFKTPSLEGLARFVAPLSVSTAEMRTRLLFQTPYGLARLSPVTGGDGSESAAAADSKVRKDFNPVAYFNPAVRTRPDGTAEVSFRLPDTMTAYRVYAVACDKGSGFASAQRELVVAKPFYLEPGLPAFLTKGDRFTLLVSSFNKTGEPGKGTFAAGKNEFVELSGAPATFDIAPLDRILLPVQGVATSPGAARLRFSGTLGAFSDAVEVQLPVNSGLLPWHDVVSGTFKGAETIRYAFPKGTEKISWKEVRPGEVRAILTVSGSPFLRMAPGVRYLLHYPYGCIEQTSSGAIPLAALRELIRQGMLPGVSLEETDKFLRAGVERILKMQLPDGGFSYWPGERQAHPWGAIYAISALTFAKRSGFPVPEDRLAKGVSFLSTWAGAGDASRDDDQRAFAAFLLALNGSLPDPLYASLLDRLPNLTREGALLTLLAGKHSGRITGTEIHPKVRMLLERARDEKAPAFQARYRGAAVALLAGAEFLPDDPATGKQASELLRGINPQGYWTSTSDTGWSLLALGEYYRGKSFSGAPVTVTVRQAGKPDLSAPVAPGKSHDFVLDTGAFLARPEVSLSMNGNTTLLYLLDLAFPRMDYARSGHSNGFRVEKTISPLEGGKTIKVGDIVRVDVSFETGFRDLEYVVLDDPLPAGLMAINSALKTEEQPRGRQKEEQGPWNYWDGEWGAYRFQPNHFELREDRVLAFRDRIWWGGKFRYSYFARAVLAGEFVLPSTKVQLMYEPDVAGYTPVGKLVIEAR